jgi:hypothetical protein
METLSDYLRDKRWLKGVKPPAKGRRWRRGQTTARPPKPLHHLVIHPVDGVLPSPDGQRVTFVIQQLVPAEGWHARYSDDEGGMFTAELSCFALALITAGDQTSPGILGIDYTPEEGWRVCNTHDNFLALVDPWSDDD